MENDNKIKDEINYCNNYEIKYKNDIIANNRIRSARKFLEENENKFNCDNPINKNNFNEFIYKYKKEPNLNFENNDFLYIKQKDENNDLNKVYNKNPKKVEIQDSNLLKKDFNYMCNNPKVFHFFNDKEPFFFGSRRNHIPNIKNDWGT